MPVYVVTMAPSVVKKRETDMAPSHVIQRIREALKNNGGESVLPIMLGDATLRESIALEPLVGPFDILVTRHKSVAAYNKAMRTEEYQLSIRGKHVLTFGFVHNYVYTDVILPALKQMYGYVREKRVDMRQKRFVDAGGKVDYSLHQVTGEKGLKNYKKRVSMHPNRPFYMIEFRTTNDTPDGRADDQEHTTLWQQAMFSSGIEMIYGGKIVSLTRGPKVFKEVGIYKFPSRELFLDMLECDHYGKMVQLEERYVLDRFVALCMPVY
jgi:hypothetical protein